MSGCNEKEAARTSGCNENGCQLCGRPRGSTAKGRPRRFCIPAHRVAFHRLKKRCGSGDLAEAVRAWRAAHMSPVPRVQRSAASCRNEVLDELADLLEQIEPLKGRAHLRHLADQAEELLQVLDEAAELTWAIDDDQQDAGDALNDLRKHRKTLEILADLVWLADEAEQVASAVRTLRRNADDLRGQAEES